MTTDPTVRERLISGLGDKSKRENFWIGEEEPTERKRISGLGRNQLREREKRKKKKMNKKIYTKLSNRVNIQLL